MRFSFLGDAMKSIFIHLWQIKIARGLAAVSVAFYVFLSPAFAVDTARSESTVCEAGVASFRKNLHPLLMKKCMECHDENGMGPTHTVLDPVASYSKIRKYVDFMSIPRSMLVTKGGNWHCRGRAGSPDCGSSPEALTSALQAWWDDGEKGCALKNALITKAQPLPKDLPVSDSQFTPIEWDLGDVRPALKGIIFKIFVQGYSQPSATTSEAYRFRSPEIYSKTALPGRSFEVKGIKVLINGAFDPMADSYARLKVHTDDQTMTPFLLSTRDLIVLDDQGAKADQISIAFEEIAIRSPVECRDVSTFVAVMSETQLQCTSGCHGSQDSPAAQAWNLKDSPKIVCMRYLTRINKYFVAQSPLVQMALGRNGHHVVNLDTTKMLNQIRKWMEKEPGINEY